MLLNFTLGAKSEDDGVVLLTLLSAAKQNSVQVMMTFLYLRIRNRGRSATKIQTNPKGNVFFYIFFIVSSWSS